MVAVYRAPFVGVPQFRDAGRVESRRQPVHGQRDYGESRPPKSLIRAASHLAERMPSQTLLPLHFNFCRTTLKNDTSGITASGKLFSAFQIFTTDPTSTRIGSLPSTVR